MKNILIIGIVVVVIGVIAYLFLGMGKGYTSPSNTNSSAAPTTEATVPNTIVIKNFAFSPATLTVKAGTVVTWTNNDSVTHNIKSTGFNSPDLATGDSFKFTFNTAGTYSYNCGIHPTMTGTIVVE